MEWSGMELRGGVLLMGVMLADLKEEGERGLFFIFPPLHMSLYIFLF